MVAGRRTRSAIAGRTEVRACLQCPGRQFAVGTAGTLRKLAFAGGNIHHQPMPEARAGRCVRVVARDREALGPLRHARPLEMRRLVATSAAETKINRKYKIVRQIVAIVETVAADRECHGGLLSGDWAACCPIWLSRGLTAQPPFPFQLVF